MKRAATFEKVWHRVELGWTVAEVATGAAADLAAELEMADALRALGGSIEAPATAAAWTALQEKLDADVPVRRTHPGAPARAARTLLAIAAAFTLLVAVSLHAEPGSPLYGVRRGAEQVAVALSPNDRGIAGIGANRGDERRGRCFGARRADQGRGPAGTHRGPTRGGAGRRG